ncbi:hypothetical protein SISSUDRAFT_523743 [Sistotremastrum suecicum HHB10207 ss-3]|uniref:DUF6532 domain-containing protein n=1 Tax=Sistotremastrum suecicum HHB10207 ss-3 TaxID=1314776 RepID=A0A166F518_9AGAM|nr:hypothetical protein SISSUDRAFT_523743 [Sistotremastrum suecicum HHB10207 ss-3]
MGRHRQPVLSEDGDAFESPERNRNDVTTIFDSPSHGESEGEEPPRRLQKRTDKTNQYDKEVQKANKRASQPKKKKESARSTQAAINAARALKAQNSKKTPRRSSSHGKGTQEADELSGSHTEEDTAPAYVPTPTAAAPQHASTSTSLADSPRPQTAKDLRTQASVAYTETLRKRIGQSGKINSPERRRISPKKSRLIYRHPDNLHRNKGKRSPFARSPSHRRSRGTTGTSSPLSSPLSRKRHRNADPEDSEGAHTSDEDAPVKKAAKQSQAKPREKAKLEDYTGETLRCMSRAIVLFKARMGHEKGFLSDPEEPSIMATECFDDALRYYGKNIALDENMIFVIYQAQTQLRTVMKTACGLAFAATFGLKTGEQYTQANKDIAATLYNKHGYLWETPPTINVPGSGKGMFRNELITLLITRAFFSGHKKNVIAAQFPMLFKPVPLPAIALACTVIENCVDEWALGSRKHLDFSADNYREKYLKHCKRLEEFADSGPERKARLAEIQMELYENGRIAARMEDINIVLDDGFEEEDYAVDDKQK